MRSLIILGMLLLLSACTVCDCEEALPEDEYLIPIADEFYAFDVDVVVGEEGASPERNKIDADKKFSIRITIENIGTKTLPAGESRVFITGVTNPGVFGLRSLKQLERRPVLDLKPDQEIMIEFGDLTIDTSIMGETGGKLEANFCHTVPGSRYENCYVKRELYSIK